jgi:hypothetical protein
MHLLEFECEKKRKGRGRGGNIVRKTSTVKGPMEVSSVTSGGPPSALILSTGRGGKLEKNNRRLIVETGGSINVRSFAEDNTSRTKLYLSHTHP